MDMTEHWLATTELERASQAVRDLQARMSRAAQIATVGELAGSIAHEVNQPLAAVVANGHACLRWLSASPPNFDKAVEAADRIVKDGKDAGEVVRRVRSCSNAPPLKGPLDLSEVIAQVLRLLDSERVRRSVPRTVLETDLPPVFGRSRAAAATGAESHAQRARSHGTGQRPREAVHGPIDTRRERRRP